MRFKILIVSANYYKDISLGLESSAKAIFKIEKIKWRIIQVPGVLEIPYIISKNIKKYDGFVALGCVIKGETPHFNFISKSTIDALMKLSVNNKKPIGNGIITCLNKDQASNRSYSGNEANIKKKNKGKEAANAVLSLLEIK